MLRTEIPANASFVQVLRQARETALDAYLHEDIPFEKVLEAVNPKRSLSHTPLFQVFINMLALPEPLALELPDVEAEIIDLPETTAKFNLTLYIYGDNRNIELSLAYSADLFVPERIAEMLQQFTCLLEQIVNRFSESINQFSLVTRPARSILPDPRAVLT